MSWRIGGRMLKNLSYIFKIHVFMLIHLKIWHLKQYIPEWRWNFSFDCGAENLLLTADHKTVKLADFGLAREESLTEMMTAETGTYRWMAPEVVH